MSKKYEQFQLDPPSKPDLDSGSDGKRPASVYDVLLNKKTKRQVPVPEVKTAGEAAQARPTAVSPTVKWVSIVILFIALATLVLALSMPAYLPRLKAIATGKPKTAPRPKTPPAQQAAEPRVVAISLVEPLPAPKEQPQQADVAAPEPPSQQEIPRQETTEQKAQVPFITTIEIVEPPAQEQPTIETARAEPVQDVETTKAGAVEIEIEEPASEIQLERSAVPAKEADTGTEQRQFVNDFDRAVSLQRTGQHLEAIAFYKKYLARHPEHAGALNNMGIIYQQQKDYEKAIGTYNRAIASDPSNYRTYNNLATCYIAQRNYRKALTALKHSLEIEPDNRAALINAGVAHIGLRNFQAAEEYLMRASQKFPQEPQAAYNLAHLYRWQLLTLPPDAAADTERAEELHQKAFHYYRLFLEISHGRYPLHEARVRELLQELEESE